MLLKQPSITAWEDDIYDIYLHVYTIRKLRDFKEILCRLNCLWFRFSLENVVIHRRLKLMYWQINCMKNWKLMCFNFLSSCLIHIRGMYIYTCTSLRKLGGGTPPPPPIKTVYQKHVIDVFPNPANFLKQDTIAVSVKGCYRYSWIAISYRWKMISKGTRLNRFNLNKYLYLAYI